MFTWLTLGEGLQAESYWSKGMNRCEQPSVVGRPGIQNVRDKSWRLLYAIIKTRPYKAPLGFYSENQYM